MSSNEDLNPPRPARWRRRQMAALAAVSGMLLAGVMSSAVASASADVTNTASEVAVYTLENQATGGVADNVNKSTSEGNPIGDFPSNGGANQQWSIQPAQPGYYTIQNNQTGMCLDVYGSETTDGAPVIQWPCNGQDNQKWAINYTGTWNDGSPVATIVNKNSGMYLAANATALNTALFQTSVVAGAGSNGVTGYNNQWTLVRSTGGVPTTIQAVAEGASGSATADPSSAFPGMDGVVDVPNWTTTPGTQMDLWNANGGDNQRWYVQAAGMSITVGWDSVGTIYAYRIINVYGNDWADARCLEEQGNPASAGTKVVEDTCDANSIDQSNQLWYIVGRYSGSVPFPYSGSQYGYEILSVPGTVTSDGSFDKSLMLATTSTFAPGNGTLLTLDNLNSDWTRDTWNLNAISSSSSGSSSSCSGYSCLLAGMVPPGPLDLWNG